MEFWNYHVQIAQQVSVAHSMNGEMKHIVFGSFIFNKFFSTLGIVD